jgi:hypothetical protein
VPRAAREFVSHSFSRYLASTIGIVVFETIFDRWIRGDEPAGTTGAIHLFHPIAELETGFDHAFLVGILFIVGMIVLTVQLREDDAREEARE